MSPDPSATPVLVAPRRWTLQEAKEQLAADPKDAYMQYVALQLAHRSGQSGQILSNIEAQTRQAWFGRNGSQGRGPDTLDLMSLFSGAAAVQECLQLEAMRSGFGISQSYAAANLNSELGQPISLLQGPKVNSHPWEEMLSQAKLRPRVSALASCLPADFLFAESRSAARLMDAVKMFCSWGDVLSRQFSKKAHAKNVLESIVQQLILPNPAKISKEQQSSLLNIECALASSDLFLSEGSDLSVLFRVPDSGSDAERRLLSGWLEASIADSGELQLFLHSYGGIDYSEYNSPDHRIHAFVAQIKPGLHIRSNSRRALHRIIEVCCAANAAGSLGQSTEFAYMRTLMPELEGADEVLIYLSEPFIARLVGPELRITEQRRLSCYARMKMLEYAVLLYRSEFGKQPSLEDLERQGCSPGLFNQGNLICSEGGKYSIVQSGENSVACCSHHGRSNFMTPCIDIPVTTVLEHEAQEYKVFVENYSRYWQTFFDPIAIRVSHDPIQKTQSIETIILPLIQNSIYSGLAQALAGQAPVNLEHECVPKSNIFTAAIRFDKSALIDMAARDPRSIYAGLLSSQLSTVDFASFFQNGLGDQLSFNVFDSEPPFSLDISQMLSTLLAWGANARGAQPGAQMNPMFVWIAFMVGAINSPIYLTLPVLDQFAVDRFIEQLENALPQALKANRVQSAADLYSFNLPGGYKGSCIAISFLAAKFRIYWARIGDTFYLASKQSILLEICQSLCEGSMRDSINYSSKEVEGHAMLRVRNANWRKILGDTAVGQSETNRHACLENLSPLSQRARSGLPLQTRADHSGELRYCPDGGNYCFDGRSVSCSIHGNSSCPKQLPSGKSAEMMSALRAMTAQLSFLEDGLKAKLTFDLEDLDTSVIL